MSPSPPFPIAVSAQIRMAVVTTRAVSALTDFYDLRLSLAVLGPRRLFPCCFPCWLGCHSVNRPSLLTNSHVHWPSAPGSGPAAWSATESPSHGTLGLKLMVALVCPSLGRSPLTSSSDRNWKGGGSDRYPRSSPTASIESDWPIGTLTSQHLYSIAQDSNQIPSQNVAHYSCSGHSLPMGTTYIYL